MMMTHGLHNFMRRGAAALAVMAALLAGASGVRGQYRADHIPAGPPVAVENPSIQEKTGTLLPLDATFTAADGKTVKLGDIFGHNKPMIVSLVYYSCPSLCGFNQQALVDAVLSGPRDLKLGTDYDIVIVSIDPDDTPADSAKKKEMYQAKIGRGPTDPGLTYLTGTEGNISALAEAIGFGYKRNPLPQGDKFLHSTGIFVCTPEGRVSQTILGLQYEPDQLHLALVDASHGKLGRGLLSIALGCGAMHFNPNTGKYEHNPWFYAGTAGGLLSMACVGVFLAVMWRGEMRGTRAREAMEATGVRTGEAAGEKAERAGSGDGDVEEGDGTRTGKSGL
jgi:protein SCO1/2